jgi:hypothetical protein
MIFTKSFWGMFFTLLITAFFAEGVFHFLPFSKLSPDPIPRWVEYPLCVAFFGALLWNYVTTMLVGLVQSIAEEVVLRLERTRSSGYGDNDAY